MPSLSRLTGPPDIAITGIDPGNTAGFGVLLLQEGKIRGARAYQCDAASAAGLLGWILADLAAIGAVKLAGGIESFADGSGPGARGTYAKMTRAMVVTLSQVAADAGCPLAARPAVLVKTWATEARLKQAALSRMARGQRHAMDGLRHALFCACHDFGVRDPLGGKFVTAP